MGHRFQFNQAVEILHKLSQAKTSDEIYELREAMEQVILDHYPRSPQEAGEVLSTLIINVEAGPRTDRRDIKALANLRHWCASLAKPATAAETYEALAVIHR